MASPKVSIIIPIYNISQYLSKCLDSLINQTLKDIQIICVNDGSTDNSLSIIQKYANSDNRILLINKKNGGLSDARNVGLQYAEGEYYMFVDGDDWLDLTTCADTYDLAESYNADVVMFSYCKEFGSHSHNEYIFEEDLIVWDKEDILKNIHRRLFGPIGEETSAPHKVDVLVSACMQLYKTKVFKDLRFYDNRAIGTFEDGLYQIMLYNICNRFVFTKKAFYHYRKNNETSITSSYNPFLYDRWNHLYDILSEFIDKSNYGHIYEEAISNRIAICFITLCLNQTRSKLPIAKNVERLREILKSPRYHKAMAGLQINEMPPHWKLFFFLAKHNRTFELFLLSRFIEYLRLKKR